MIDDYFIDRCLDEFDVFMDNVNRSIAMEMMIHTTKKHKGQQFIFLTPLVSVETSKPRDGDISWVLVVVD